VSQHAVSNTITPVYAKNQNAQQIYQWACMLTTEQKEDSKNYFWIPEAKALLRRLESTTGNMIAVIGLQGSGKTALKQALELELANKDFNVFSLKWVGDIHEKFVEKTLQDKEEQAEYFDELMQLLVTEELPKVASQRQGAFSQVNVHVYDLSKQILKRLGLQNSENSQNLVSYLKAFYSTENCEKDLERHRHSLLKLLPLVEKALGKKRTEKVKGEFLIDKLQTAHTILIDLPDYDRNSSKEMYRDLTTLQSWWENIFTDASEGYKQNVNLVLFFQKELFHGHFFIGKLDTYELKPLTPDELTEYFKKTFGDYAPFTEEAIREICILSRGIFRRFKKYIRICLDHYFDNTITVISRENVNSWISLDQIVKDMELELMTIFPKERENRISSVKLLRLLRQKGPLSQSKIAEEIFEGATMRTSRVLDKLESWGYIKRERSGKEKIVSLT
jgi:hypothetical protein